MTAVIGTIANQENEVVGHSLGGEDDLVPPPFILPTRHALDAKAALDALSC
jgi:hypothetical protein